MDSFRKQVLEPFLDAGCSLAGEPVGQLISRVQAAHHIRGAWPFDSFSEWPIAYGKCRKGLCSPTLFGGKS